MPTYTSIDNTRKEIDSVYVGYGNTRKPILSLRAGINATNKIIFESIHLIDSIVVQLEAVDVYDASESTDEEYIQGDLIHEGSGYGEYADLEVALQSSSSRLKISLYPKNLKQDVSAILPLYAKLKDGTLVPISILAYANQGFNNDLGTLEYNYIHIGRYSGSSSWHIWYTFEVLSTFMELDNSSQHSKEYGPISVISSQRSYANSNLYISCTRTHGQGYTYMTVGDLTIAGKSFPLTFVNLLTP